jgi:hypothetical protein
MKNVTVKEMRAKCKELPIETQSALFRQLICAVLNEAVEDYVGTTPLTIKKLTPKYFFDKSTIMKDLKSPRMVALSSGMSETVAMHLRKNAAQIKVNMQKMANEVKVMKVEIHDTPQYR